jgi:hypothetical protein
LSDSAFDFSPRLKLDGSRLSARFAVLYGKAILVLGDDCVVTLFVRESKLTRLVRGNRVILVRLAKR